VLLPFVPGAFVWPAAMIVWGPGSASAEHRHHCVQLVMAITGALRARRTRVDQWLESAAVLVRPDAAHEVDARDVPVLIAFVDAVSELGAALLHQSRADITCISAAKGARWRKTLGAAKDLSEVRVETWVRAELLHRRRPVTIPAQVARVLDYLRQQIGISEDLSLAALARVARLSPSRLMHVFTASVGVPIRPYVLWLRIQVASSELVRGARVAEAAQRAGFADAAHLARTFRRMLGATPSEIAGRRASRTVAISK
jgi:AraC-like DNA-binding protein